jgi:transposase-like protein
MAKQRSRGVAVAKSWTANEARAVLETWEKSGQSGAAFARSIGVVSQRLFWWRKRLGQGAAVAEALRFVSVVARVPERTGSSAVVVTTATGIRIEVHEVDASTAAWVAAVLGGEHS